MDVYKKRISWFGQVNVYLGKCFRLFIHEKQWKNFITSFVLILIIIAVTSKDMFKDFPDTKYGLFTVICGCIWVGLFNSIQSICRERAIIKREYRTGLKLSAYITAHAIYEAFLCAIEAMIILILLYCRYGSNIEGEGLITASAADLYVTFFLVVFGADTMAMFVSSLVRKENTAMTIMPFILIVQLVMSGAIFSLGEAASAVANVTISKWGLEAVLRISDKSTLLFGSPIDQANPNPTYRSYFWCQKYLNPAPTNGDPEAEKLLLAWGVMILITVVFLAASTLILRLVEKDKRI